MVIRDFVNLTSSGSVCLLRCAQYNIVDVVVPASVPGGVSGAHVGESDAARFWGDPQPGPSFSNSFVATTRGLDASACDRYRET